MAVNISAILGARYDSLIDAQVDKSPDEVVVTDDNETFYIVRKEVYVKELIPFGYEIVVEDGE